jgi:hypothetical protein
MSSNYNANWSPFSGNLGNMSIWDMFYEDQPRVGYSRWQEQSFGPNTWQTNYGNWLDKNYDNYKNQYLASMQDHGIDYRWMDFLRDNTSGIQEQFRRQTPRQRGENPDNFSGRVRWIGT